MTCNLNFKGNALDAVVLGKENRVKVKDLVMDSMWGVMGR